jgi:hypothetical protein
MSTSSFGGRFCKILYMDNAWLRRRRSYAQKHGAMGGGAMVWSMAPPWMEPRSLDIFSAANSPSHAETDGAMRRLTAPSFLNAPAYGAMQHSAPTNGPMLWSMAPRAMAPCFGAWLRPAWSQGPWKFFQPRTHHHMQEPTAPSFLNAPAYGAMPHNAPTDGAMLWSLAPPAMAPCFGAWLREPWSHGLFPL